MEHGRRHDERQHKAARPRASNIPDDEPDTDLEAQLALSGRGGLRPPEGLIGAHERRSAGPSEPEEPAAPGSDVAPTAQAERRERERHRLERELGRVAAGTAGRVREARNPDVDRDQLRAAAEEADRRVAGRELRGAGGDLPPRPRGDEVEKG